MKHSLTIAYCTARKQPEFGWFLDSIRSQFESGDKIQVLIVNGTNNMWYWPLVKETLFEVEDFRPKPTVWSGPLKLTRDEWWSKSNSLNSALCKATGEYFCTMDDRSVLMPGWLDGIRRQMDSPFPYVLAGSYQKRVSMTVEHGVIKNAGIIIGEDNRTKYCREHYEPHGLKPPFKADKGWTYGVTICAPLEWFLEINGFSEEVDGLSGEDYLAGNAFHNQGYPIYFDPRMMVVEDRTPELCGPVAIRSDFGTSPNDYSHKVLKMAEGRKTAMHPFNLRELRADIQSGKPWPKPWGPTHHAWDGKPLSELEKPK